MSENGSLAEWLDKIGIGKELNNSDILNGITINTTLTKIIPNYTVRLSTANTASNRITNWNTVLNELEKLGIHVGQQDKTKILNGDDKIVYNILYELKGHFERSREEVEVDINKIDSRGDPRSAKSLLQLFILVIVKYYGLSVKQSVALLSNDSKYLAHILAKGFKESAKPVQGMLGQFMKLLPQINVFCRNQENQLFFIKSIKPGLISKYLTISEISLEILTEFIKNVREPFEVVKTELMSTFVLCLRRHSCLCKSLVQSLTSILGYNKNILTLITSHSSVNEATIFLIELLNQAEQQGNTAQIFQMFKFQEFMLGSIQNMKNSQLIVNSGAFLLKIAELGYSNFIQNSTVLNKLIENLYLLNLSKRIDVFVFTDVVFALLHIFGKKKNNVAPLFFKLAVEKYKSTINQDESHNFLLNFLNIVSIFPSIPMVGLVEAILARFEMSTCVIGQLQLQIIENSIDQVDEKLALKVYNTITKMFVEEIGSGVSISNILQIIIRKFDSKIIFDLNVKFVKVCLAVYYANLRKLNYSKSLVQGTIKLDLSNAFYKAKNNQIQHLLRVVISINDKNLNSSLQPLICYSFIQSQMKNKQQSEGIKKIMLLLGDQETLRGLYQNDAKILLEEAKNQGRKKGQPKQANSYSKYKEGDSKIRVSSDASLLVKKKNYLLINPQKISMDAQKGLEKYTKVFKEKMVKLSLQQERKLLEQQKLQELRRKFSMKVAEKGLKIMKELTINCIYEFNAKQNEMNKDIANDFSHLPFYDPQFEEDRDVRGIQYIIKKYSKIFRVYYNNYGGKLRPNTIKLFQDMSQTSNLMQTANVMKLFRDHDLDQFITVKQVQFTVQKINSHLKKQYNDASLLDYDVFQNFLIQAALIMFSRPPKDMRSHPLPDMLGQIVSKLKQKAKINNIGQKIFSDLQNEEATESEEINQLNLKLAQNAEYILPEGFKKIKTSKMNYDYQFKFQPQSEIRPEKQQVFQVLDTIFVQKLGFHLIEPYSNTVTEVTARSILYPANNIYSMKQRSLSSALPRQSKIRQPKNQKQEEQGKIQKQQSKNEDQFQDKSKILLKKQKLQNKILKERKQKQMQLKRRQEQEERKRQQRDKELKLLLQKNREKQEQIEKQKKQQQLQQQRKRQIQKTKRMKHEEDLKRKLSEYLKKKEIEKVQQDQSHKKSKDLERKNMQKLKQDVERKKKMVEQSKQRKQQQQNERLQKQRIQKAQRQQENKRKMQQKKDKIKSLLQQYKQSKKKSHQTKQLNKTQSVDQLTKKSKLKNKKSKVDSKQQEKINQKSGEIKVQEMDHD